MKLFKLKSKLIRFYPVFIQRVNCESHSQFGKAPSVQYIYQEKPKPMSRPAINLANFGWDVF